MTELCRFVNVILFNNSRQLTNFFSHFIKVLQPSNTTNDNTGSKEAAGHADDDSEMPSPDPCTQGQGKGLY